MAQTTTTRRFDTLAAVKSWTPATKPPGNGNSKTPMNIEEIFGENTFGLNEMKARLPKPTYKALLATIESGAELDASLARVREIATQVTREGGGGAKLLLVAFDQTAELVYDGAAAALGNDVIDRLRRRQALGASNLEAALGFVAEHAGRAPGLRNRQPLHHHPLSTHIGVGGPPSGSPRS